MDNRELIHPVTGELLSGDDIWPTANMFITFENGDAAVYQDVRFLAIPGFIDPIKLRYGGAVMEFETADDKVITLLGVRSFMFDHTS